MQIKALIFDVDGTLSETEDVHLQAFNDTFAEFGLDWQWSRDLYRELLKTTGGKERMTVFVRDHLRQTPDLDLIARIHVEKTARYGALISQGAATLRPGIVDLIKDTAQQGCRLALATTTNRPNVDRLIEATIGRSASEIFEVIAAGDEVANKKPAPDVFNLALKGLGLDARNCVALEDSRNGLMSAKGAGIPCIVSPSVYTYDAAFPEAGAVVGCFSQVATLNDLRKTLMATTGA
jgi:HAD superfamily hydrolase (TIGR01509 family)